MKKVAYSPVWSFWAPPLIWTLVLLVLSGNLGSLTNTAGPFKWVVSRLFTLDPDTLDLLHFYFRKTVHVIFYGILGVLWFRALMASYPEHFGVNWMLALTLCLTVALADEEHQYFLPSRTGSWRDVGLDLSGGVLFLFLIACYWKWKNRLLVEVKSPSP